MVVFDLPQTVQSVSKEYQQSWRKTDAELFELGLASASRNYPQAVSKAEADGFYFWYANNRHFFTANIIFELDKHPGLLGTHGSLAAFPTRHAALFYPIESAVETLKAIDTLVGAAIGMYSDGPGALTYNIYWCEDGMLTNIPYGIEDGNLHLMPPEEFSEMLNKLG